MQYFPILNNYIDLQVMVCSPNNTPQTPDLTTGNIIVTEYPASGNTTYSEEPGEPTHNNLILSFAGGSIAVLVFLIAGFAGIKVYKAKFSRRRNFNYTLSEDNGNIVGDENRVNC